MTSHVDQQIQARIAAASAKRARRRQQREELDEARAHGLEARHAAKLKRWGEAAYSYGSEDSDGTGRCDSCGADNVPLHRAVWGNPSDGTAGDGRICADCKNGSAA